MPFQNPLFIFVHLQKTAGTSLAKHIEHNLPHSQRLLITPKVLGLDDLMPSGIPQTLDNFFSDPKMFNQLRMLYSHILTKNTQQIAKKITAGKRPYYFFTILRDPARRIVSLYNYHSQWYFNERPERRDQEVFHRNLLVHGKFPSFITWYKHKFSQKTEYFSFRDSARYFQVLGYLDRGKPTKATIKKCFDQFFFVGTTETFSQDSAYLYYLWDFDKFFINQNISNKYFILKDHPEIETMLRQDLSEAYLFYEMGKAHRQQFILDHPEYVTAQNVIAKKNKMRPMHQLLYDWPNNAHLLSAYLRKSVPGYGRLKDAL